MRVLILGGTAEARALAQALTDRGLAVVSSLAGRVSRPRLPAGEVRIGGFGGASGLADFIRSERITHVVDATHPFAATMTRHGIEATAATRTPFVRYARPGWRSHPAARHWTWVESYDEARSAAEHRGARPFLTTGRQTLPYFLGAWADRDVLVRIVEPLDQEPPARWRIIHDRGPFDAANERALMGGHGVDVLLTKDSGGAYTVAKLEAAQQLDIAVVVVARPTVPRDVTEVSTIDDAVYAFLGSLDR